MAHRIWPSLILGVVVATGTGESAGQQNDAGRRRAGPDGQPAKTAERNGKAKGQSPQRTSPSDAEMTAAVERHLRRDAIVPFDRVDVQTEQGIVILTGTVDSLLAADRAAAVTADTRGVRSVVNRLSVDGGSRPDRQVRRDVLLALVNDPAVDGYEIHVTVRDGTVTLTGTTQSWAERDLAETVVRQVRGVTAIENKIVVDAKSVRPDPEVAADIRRRLDWNRRIDADRVQVDVKAGKVTLTGTVASATEKRRARSAAWIAGVTNVDDSGLEVDPQADRKELRRDRTKPRSDAEIRKAVRDALLYDPRVAATGPEVAVRDGTVTLTGTVDSLIAKNAAAEDARNTVGVRRVRNYLKVRPKDIVLNAELAHRVRSALARDPHADRHDVHVAAYGGYVFLTGSVDSYSERARAELIASGAAGVVGVRNLLTVEDALPVLSAPDITARDREIREEIKDELYWSPWVDSDEVAVVVRGGVATLTGTVDTWSESQAATENAREGGARQVINNLRVRSDTDAVRE